MTDSATSSLSELAAAAARSVAQQSNIVKFDPNNLAVSLIDLSTPGQPEYGNFRGDESFYPASIVKLFFMAAVHMGLENGTVQPTPQLLNALKEMIVDSSNEATSYVVDILTGTSSGPELAYKEMQEWSRKRKSLNEIFMPLGYSSINICQKTWDEEPDGRDKAFLGADLSNRNCLSANNAARLLEAIVQGKIAGPEHCKLMMDLLKRDYTVPSDDPDNQATGFCAAALPAGAKLWSKAGWTSQVRHDAAYIEYGDARLIMVIFTESYSSDYRLISELASAVLTEFL